MVKTRVSATIPADLVKELDSEAKKRHRNRSELLEECIKIWHQAKVGEDMKKGYLERAKKDRKLAEKDLAAQSGTLPKW